jgi:hypothetical protein
MFIEGRCTFGQGVVAFGVAALLAAGAFGCASRARQRPIEGAPVSRGPGSIEAARQVLQGRWSLLSFEVRPPGQPPIQLQGAGTLSYDAFGNMDMQIRVPDPATAQALERAGIPLSNGAIASEGRTAIDMQARVITFILAGQDPLSPTTGAGPLALSRPRHWDVEGDLLTLTTKGDGGQPLSVSRWRKTP